MTVTQKLLKWLLTYLMKIFKKLKANLNEKENNKMRKLKNVMIKKTLESDREVNTEKVNNIKKRKKKKFLIKNSIFAFLVLF